MLYFLKQYCWIWCYASIDAKSIMLDDNNIDCISLDQVLANHQVTDNSISDFRHFESIYSDLFSIRQMDSFFSMLTKCNTEKPEPQKSCTTLFLSI